MSGSDSRAFSYEIIQYINVYHQDVVSTTHNAKRNIENAPVVKLAKNNVFICLVGDLTVIL